MADFEWPGSDPNGQQQRPEIEINVDPGQMLPMLWGIGALALVAWGASTSYFTVEANEEAVVLRLGTVERVAGPGFHGKLPFGIDQAYKGAVKTVHQAEFGYRTVLTAPL